MNFYNPYKILVSKNMIGGAASGRDIESKINRAERRIVQIYQTPGTHMLRLSPPYDAPTQAGLTEIIRVLGAQNTYYLCKLSLLKEPQAIIL